MILYDIALDISEFSMNELADIALTVIFHDPSTADSIVYEGAEDWLIVSNKVPKLYISYPVALLIEGHVMILSDWLRTGVSSFPNDTVLLASESIYFGLGLLVGSY